MRIFGRKHAENERIEEDLEFEEGKMNKEEGNLICEEAIMQEKERFGRVRKSLMNYLREEYGREVADRALWRVNRRRTEGHLNYRK